MNKKSGTSKEAADKLVRGIKRKTRKHYSAEEKIRIVLAGVKEKKMGFLGLKLIVKQATVTMHFYMVGK